LSPLDSAINDEAWRGVTGHHVPVHSNQPGFSSLTPPPFAPPPGIDSFDTSGASASRLRHLRRTCLPPSAFTPALLPPAFDTSGALASRLRLTPLRFCRSPHRFCLSFRQSHPPGFPSQPPRIPLFLRPRFTLRPPDPHHLRDPNSEGDPISKGDPNFRGPRCCCRMTIK
jgi:hypothetical protein